MPKIVQFTHPGSEHGPDKGNKSHKSWNAGTHKRKFLLTNGDYVNNNNKVYSDNLMFWGEWEPPSIVSSLDNQNDKLMPKWLHRPYLPKAIPISDGYQQSFQNTDPFVFGESFKYFVCKQFVPKKKRVTQLASLDKGSIILFGSTKGKSKEASIFQLDTVFVVSEFIEYDMADIDALIVDKVSKTYRDVVFKMAFPNPANYSLKLRLYFGATFYDQYEGMYSFSPSKRYRNNQYGFPRVMLKDLKYIRNNLNAAPKISEVGMQEITLFWEEIRNISREQRCVEGVKYEYDKEHNETL